MADGMTYLLSVFAVYRLARILAMEEGPFDVFAKLRGRIDPEQKTWIGRGINCALCLGFWISLAFAIALNWGQVIAPPTLLDWLAIAGAQAALHLWIEK